jgi:hypothetical protein
MQRHAGLDNLQAVSSDNYHYYDDYHGKAELTFRSVKKKLPRKKKMNKKNKN